MPGARGADRPAGEGEGVPPGLVRLRIVAVAIAAVAWTMGAAAIAVSQPGSWSVTSFGGFIGATVGLFIGAFARGATEGVIIGFLRACRDAGLFAALIVGAVMVGVAWEPMLPDQDRDASIVFLVSGVLLLFVGSSFWDGGRARRAKVWVGLIGAFGVALAIVGVVSGPSWVLIGAGLSAAILEGALARHLRRTGAARGVERVPELE